MTVNALTIDVEDYYQVSAFEPVVRFEDWDLYESRVERNTARILDLLAEAGATATFFVLGWVSDRHPSTVKAIHAAGHEVASHGYRHRLLYHMTPAEFRADTLRAKWTLEDLAGAEVVGYRAPSFSVVERTLWGLDILQELGFQYDSSVFPIHHDRYGIPDGHRFPHYVSRREGKGIWEVPPSTVRVARLNVPIAGGGYLRLLPYRLLRWGLRRINEKEGQPAVIYLHPWELDPGQPRLAGPRIAKFRHYVNLAGTGAKLRRLLRDFRFQSVQSLLSREVSGPPGHRVPERVSP